jgi:LacI family transcriptional regulator
MLTFLTKSILLSAMTPSQTAASPDRRTSIKAVALQAGVSVSTVSRALNGYADVNAETRKRIETAAETLGYRPSYAAATLRRMETRTVTFVVSKPWTRFVDPFFLGVLDGLELALSAQGYDLQVVLAREFDTEIAAIRKTVERNRSDALIFARTRPHDERIDWLQERGFPFVAIGQTARNDHSFIDRDQIEMGRTAALRLAALGHRRIGMLTTPLRYTYSHLLRDGFRHGLQEAGLDPDPDLEAECYLSRRTGEEVVTELYARGAAPTALFCGNDMIALSAMQGLQRMGLVAGRDVALIGCDDMPLSAHLRPSLTSFSQDLEALGIKLGRMVLAQLGGDTDARQEFVESKLVLRDSDCPADLLR